ncbi:hypothetical protein N665_0087s0015 [Sinapis alba]|nr:hypothetical protein N665_0087s0015 [Sinapis alba]
MDVPQDQARDYPSRLYAEGTSNLEIKVINHNCHLRDFPIAREAIGRDVWNHLKEFPTGIIAKLADSNFLWSGRNVRYLLCRNLQYIRRFRISLLINLSGLAYTNLELNVSHGMGPKLDELRPALEVCRSSTFEKRKWLGLLLLQTMGLYALHYNSRIQFESAKIVSDDEPMMTYPWGRSAYEVLVNSNKILSPQDDKNIGDRIKVVMCERLKDLRVGENNINPIPSLPSQNSVNSPPPMADKTSAKEDEVAKATEVKKNLVKDFGNTEVDFVYVSPAKDLTYRRRCWGKPKHKEVEEDGAKKKEATELKKKQAELKKQAAELKKQKAAELRKEEERIRSARIKFYHDRGAQLSPNGLASMPSSHIDAFIRVLIERYKRDPSPLWSKNISFIVSWFLGVWVPDYQQFKLKPRQFKFKGTGYEELVNVKNPVDIQTDLNWLKDVNYLYRVINIGGGHWVGFDKVLAAFRSLTQMIPAMMSDVISASIRKSSYKQFAFQRRKDKCIPQNDLVGDCGVYSLKFIECLELGVIFDGISHQKFRVCE